MFLRYLCGCVEWNGTIERCTVYTCNGRSHSASYAPMRESEVRTFLMHVHGTLNAAESAQHHINHLHAQ